jgi:hypothetical protein
VQARLDAEKWSKKNRKNYDFIFLNFWQKMCNKKKIILSKKNCYKKKNVVFIKKKNDNFMKKK